MLYLQHVKGISPICLLINSRAELVSFAQVTSWFASLGYRFEPDGAQTIYSWLLELVSIRFHKAFSKEGEASMRSLADIVAAAGQFSLDQVGHIAQEMHLHTRCVCLVHSRMEIHQQDST